MSLKSFLAEGLRITDEILNDIIFMCETRTKVTFFTRKGKNKMEFKHIIIFILNFVKKSLQLELDNFFSKVNDPDFRVSKQAFSEARLKISPTAFVKMSDAILKWFYNDTDFKRYRGYRLLAIDGSVLEINNTEKSRSEFGYVENQCSKVARAQASGLYDVENAMILASTIAKYTTSERSLAVELINKTEEMGFKNDLFLFDRGYPSSELISFIESKNQKYLMRVSSGFLKVVTQTTKEDQIVKTKYKGKTLQIRVLRFLLDSGIEEVLITNILDIAFNTNDFKTLYFKRWGIEIEFNELKNRLQIENFTGENPIAIKQDFYASMYLSNMITLAKIDANAAITEENKDKNLKYEYKVNTNILIGKLKNSLVFMMLEKNPRKRSKILQKIMKAIAKNTVPIRPGRSNPRIMKKKHNKYPINRKSSL